MKYILLICLCFSLSITTYAQEQDDVLKSKKGTPILPQKGDIAIGADALPYLHFIGNMFNDNTNNTLNLGNQKLYFRYYLKDDVAVRFNLSINNSSETTNKYVRDDKAVALDPFSKAQLEDKRKDTYSSYSMMAGIQKFRGYGRLRGFYGAQAGYARNGGNNQYLRKQNYYYGNNITAINQTPSSYFGASMSDGRIIEVDNGVMNSVMLGGLIGVEYYFMPKVCLGGEYSLMYNHNWGGQQNAVLEKWDGEKVSEIKRALSPGDSGYSIKTDRPSSSSYAGLYLMFHF